jgi:hypothetical protein
MPLMPVFRLLLGENQAFSNPRDHTLFPGRIRFAVSRATVSAGGEHGGFIVASSLKENS